MYIKSRNQVYRRSPRKELYRHPKLLYPLVIIVEAVQDASASFYKVGSRRMLKLSFTVTVKAMDNGCRIVDLRMNAE